MHVKDIRRKNLRALARITGGVTKLAQRLEKSQSQVSHLIGTNPIKKIGDKFAAHVERVFSKPHGWLDHDHVGIEEESATYQVNPSRHSAYYVPLLAWTDVQHWITNDKLPASKESCHYIATNIKVGQKAFALRVEGDGMEAPQGVSFCNGAIIVIEPELPIKSGAYVIAKQTANSALVFKQLIIDGSHRFLKPLNHRYPVTEITSHAIIYGVVRIMMMEFK